MLPGLSAVKGPKLSTVCKSSRSTFTWNSSPAATSRLKCPSGSTEAQRSARPGLVGLALTMATSAVCRRPNTSEHTCPCRTPGREKTLGAARQLQQLAAKGRLIECLPSFSLCWDASCQGEPRVDLSSCFCSEARISATCSGEVADSACSFSFNSSTCACACSSSSANLAASCFFFLSAFAISSSSCSCLAEACAASSSSSAAARRFWPW
mmetsp:Transcript_49812/g.118723  ORF Transcript_49812/g.118723 Transcript_49812/m.118723 type:complete len:210 (+) Transcript_49812:244-873(+)